MNKLNIGVLFDLDGVLIDSESLYTEFWSGIDRLYPTGIPDFAIAIKGTNLKYILTLFPDGVRDDILRRIHDYEDHMLYPVFDGVDDFLDALAEAGVPMAVVTSSDEVKMGYLFDQQPHFATRFNAIINGSMVTRSKPHPQGYLMGAEAIGVPIERCYVFEDSLQGIEAGRRAGATVIGLTTTLPREVLEGKAHALIDGFTRFTIDDMLAVER